VKYVIVGLCSCWCCKEL